MIRPCAVLLFETGPAITTADGKYLVKITIRVEILDFPALLELPPTNSNAHPKQPMRLTLITP